MKMGVIAKKCKITNKKCKEITSILA